MGGGSWGIVLAPSQQFAVRVAALSHLWGADRRTGGEDELRSQERRVPGDKFGNNPRLLRFQVPVQTFRGSPLTGTTRGVSQNPRDSAALESPSERARGCGGAGPAQLGRALFAPLPLPQHCHNGPERRLCGCSFEAKSGLCTSLREAKIWSGVEAGGGGGRRRSGDVRLGAAERGVAAEEEVRVRVVRREGEHRRHWHHLLPPTVELEPGRDTNTSEMRAMHAVTCPDGLRRADLSRHAETCIVATIRSLVLALTVAHGGATSSPGAWRQTTTCSDDPSNKRPGSTVAQLGTTSSVVAGRGNHVRPGRLLLRWEEIGGDGGGRLTSKVRLDARGLLAALTRVEAQIGDAGLPGRQV